MCAEVDLADIVVLQDGGISGVGGVVGSAVVQGAAGGEGQAGVQPVLLYQLTGAVLQPLAGGEEVRQRERDKVKAEILWQISAFEGGRISF